MDRATDRPFAGASGAVTSAALNSRAAEGALA
jgi:hypothetical protein